MASKVEADAKSRRIATHRKKGMIATYVINVIHIT